MSEVFFISYDISAFLNLPVLNKKGITIFINFKRAFKL